MDKRIVQLLRDPFAVRRADRPVSLFIDPKVGTILIDEGEARVNGVVLYPDKAPRFSVASGTGAGVESQLQYRTFHLVVGDVAERYEAEKWASDANVFLTAKDTIPEVRIVPKKVYRYGLLSNIVAAYNKATDYMRKWFS